MSAVFLFQGHKRTGGKIPCPLFVIVPLPASAGSRRGRHRDQRRSRDPYASLSRGRPPGETAELLRKGCLQTRKGSPPPRIVLKEEEALQEALAAAAEGDMIVIFYEEFPPLLEALSRLKAAEASSKTPQSTQRQVN